jgi:hypothetical protein
MALVCAVEPSAFRVPLEHVGAPAVLLPVDVLGEVPLVEAPPELPDDFALLLQAASAATATSTPAATPARLSFTIGSPSSV